MASVATRQAASPTARMHGRLAQRAVTRLLMPRHGAFNHAVAVALIGWQQL